MNSRAVYLVLAGVAMLMASLVSVERPGGTAGAAGWQLVLGPAAEAGRVSFGGFGFVTPTCVWRGQFFQVPWPGHTCAAENAARDAADAAARNAAAAAAAVEKCKALVAANTPKVSEEAANARKLREATTKALLGDLSDLKALDEAAKGAAGAAKGAAAVATQLACDKAKAAEADKAVKAAEADAQRASAIWRAAQEALELKMFLEKHVDGVRTDALEIMRYARMLMARAPKALEAFGGLEGGAKQKYQRAYTAIRYRIAKAFRLVKVAQALQLAAQAPRDDAAVDHLVNLSGPRSENLRNTLLAEPGEKEIDKELDNLSLKELGVKGDKENGELDPKNLEHPFDKAREILARFARSGTRYLGALADFFLPAHKAYSDKLKEKFQEALDQTKVGLKAIIQAITGVQKGQRG